MDFDEFATWCRGIGAEPICVINLESGFVHGNVDAAVTEAADWVRYSNVEKGYGVRYWEIGNETDLLGTRHCLTAQQYADAFVRFSKAMKAVDPTIRIGALGPTSPDHRAPFDGLTPAEQQQVLSLRSVEVQTLRQEGKLKPDLSRAAPWWSTLIDTAGERIDFAIIHRYDSTRPTFPRTYAAPYRLDEMVRRLDAFLTDTLGRTVPIALTEWNVWRNCELSPAEHALSVAEMTADYLVGGVDRAKKINGLCVQTLFNFRQYLLC